MAFIKHLSALGMLQIMEANFISLSLELEHGKWWIIARRDGNIIWADYKTEDELEVNKNSPLYAVHKESLIRAKAIKYAYVKLNKENFIAFADYEGAEYYKIEIEHGS